MKDEAQRIAIAIACGAKVVMCSCGLRIRDAITQKHIPDYLNDLNAMHSAEMKFVSVSDVLDRRSYMSNLMKAVDVNPDMQRWSFIQDFILCHATARQRAEAFIKTLNLWNETAD